MTRLNRRVAGHPLPGRAQLAEARAKADLTEQAWRNFIALRRFSGDAWIDRYREHQRRRVESPTVPIPAQRRPHEDRWDAFINSSYGTARHGHPLHGAAARAVAAKHARERGRHA